MAQAFRRFGSEVTIVSFENTVLFRDDRELTALLRESLAAEGIQFLFDSTVSRIEPNGKEISNHGRKSVFQIQGDDRRGTLSCLPPVAGRISTG